MNAFARLGLAGLLLAACAAPPPAPPVVAAPVAAPVVAPPPAATPEPVRIHIVGASVSGGFEDTPLAGAREAGDSVALQAVLKAWAGEHGVVTAHNPNRMVVMFTDPERIGREQLAAATRAAPQVLVAIDFPFWYAYGRQPNDDARRQRLQRGLDALAAMPGALLLGDLPDMHGAAPRMLPPAAIPKPALLAELNRVVAAFAAAAPQRQLLPLAELVRVMKDQGVELPLATGILRTPPGALLQGDRLHATRLGMAYLGFVLQDPLAKSMPAGHPLASQRWSFEQFVHAVDAADELAALVEAGARR